MNFKYYFPTLVLTGIFFLCSCGHHNDPSAPDDPSPLHISRPDSAYMYMIGTDSVETLTQLIYFTYDANGNMILEFDSVIAPPSPYSATKTRIVMQYDEKGNMIVEKRFSFMPMDESWDWVNGRCTLYDYDAHNKLSEVSFYEQYSEPLSNPTKKGYYSWIDDEHASCLSYRYYKYAANPWVLTERVEFTYNAQGKIIKNASFSVAGDSTIVAPWVTNTYEYDKYGNLVLHISIDHQGGGSSSSSSYKYEYDASGNILIKWYGNGNSKEENIKYTRKYVYFY